MHWISPGWHGTGVKIGPLPALDAMIDPEVLFEVRGPSSGGCGHQHPDVASALACLRRHQAEQTSAGGFSDRQIVPIGVPVSGRLAAVRALQEAEALYRAGARRDALQRLDELPGRVDALVDAPDIAQAQRWVSRARERIASQLERHDPRAAAYLRAAANAIARTG